MNPASFFRVPILLAALLTLIPILIAGLGVERIAARVLGFPRLLQLGAPAVLCIPYILVATSCGNFDWKWLAFYCLIPMGVAVLLDQAWRADRNGRGDWRDFLVLAALGLAVDLRWLEPAWSHGFAVVGKMILLDAGIYGFLVIRRLDGVGFHLCFRRRDLRTGFREFFLYAVLALPLGLVLGFLHTHATRPQFWGILGAYLFTFVCIALPEELFFRGWLQNLLERRLGPRWALLLTSALFGLAHWNKRTTSFNWRYVLLAALAGIFYGRAWVAQRRVAASSITHATVDTLWSIWLR
jgi:uncharacterized protein